MRATCGSLALLHLGSVLMSMAPVTTKDHSRYPLSEGPPEITLISRHSTVLSWFRPSRCEHGRAGSIPSLGSTGKTGFESLGSRDLTPTLVHCSGGKLALRTGELVPPLAVLHLIWAAQQSHPQLPRLDLLIFFLFVFFCGFEVAGEKGEYRWMGK